ncbi:MAG: helix-turn-helix domain-containing protein [Coriobacteriia bacterium]|nr:helix-turn-helix domain-containing protein [Coriobacteriia bacterium]
MEGTTTTERRLLDVRELAAILAVPESWVYQRTADGSIPHVRVGRYVRFDLARVMRWLEAEHGAARAARAR